MPRDSTRKLLKVFGVAVTDFEDESELLIERATELGAKASLSVHDVIPLLKDAVELWTDMNLKWLEVTQLIFNQQRTLYERLTELSARISGATSR